MASPAPDQRTAPFATQSTATITLANRGCSNAPSPSRFAGWSMHRSGRIPAVDMEALAIQPDSHVVTIASGGCNALSYLTANPRAITAVDLNTAHIALNQLKRVAAQAFARLRGVPSVLSPRPSRRPISRRTGSIHPPAPRRGQPALLGRPRLERAAADRRVRARCLQARSARRVHRRGAHSREAPRSRSPERSSRLSRSGNSARFSTPSSRRSSTRRSCAG